MRGSYPRYIACSREKKLVIDKDMITAQLWLDMVKSRCMQPGYVSTALEGATIAAHPHR